MYGRDQAGQELSDDEMKPKEWYGWRDILRSDNVDAANMNYIQKLADCWPMSQTHLRGLKALAISTHVYLQLDGATISVKVFDAPLSEAPWLPEISTSCLTRQNLERSRTLAFIVHFESGVLLLLTIH